MARKSLGHIELEWPCPKCGIRNPGGNHVCNGCGAPQPEYVEFQNPVAAEMVKDEVKLAQATAGPDIHCPYCNARNRSNATLCVQCGGDLTAAAGRSRGQVLGALHIDPDATTKCHVCGAENPAQLFSCTSCGAPLRGAQSPTPRPAPAAKANGGCSLLGIGTAAVIALLAIGAIFFFFTGTAETVQATVVEAQWSRSIEVQGMTPVVQEAWREQIPANATVLSCRQEVQSSVDEPVANSREVCGTAYVEDEGTGFGEVVQDCQYEVLADYCSYETLEWRKVDDVQINGVGHELRWPELAINNDQREGSRSQVLECVLDSDGRTFTYRTPTDDLFAACVTGARWELELNRVGGISGAMPR